MCVQIDNLDFTSFPAIADGSVVPRAERRFSPYIQILLLDYIPVIVFCSEQGGVVSVQWDDRLSIGVYISLAFLIAVLCGFQR